MVKKKTDAPTAKKVEAKPRRTVKTVLTEKTTWAGLFTVGAAVLTGGMSVLTDPILLAQIGAGFSLVLAEG